MVEIQQTVKGVEIRNEQGGKPLLQENSKSTMDSKGEALLEDKQVQINTNNRDR